jgi:hypothetical protein
MNLSLHRHCAGFFVFADIAVMAVAIKVRTDLTPETTTYE